jgi:LacI family transcriptional regulator
LREAITIGRTGRPTIRDIAALAGVSAGTVSRAMNGKDGVGAEVRARIERIVAEQDFRADASARTLSTGRSRSVAIVFPLHASEVVVHPVYPALLGALGDAAEEAGYDVMLQTASTGGHARRLLERVRDRRIDGVVLPAAGSRDPLLKELRVAGVPTVLIGHRTGPGGPPWVDSTHDAAAAELARTAIAAGRRRLLLLNGPKRVSACRLRAAGFWSAVQGVEASELDGEFDADQARDLAKAALAGPDRPDAILCGADIIAAGVLDAARALGLSVPGDVAVSGFDDRSLATHTTPTLTTVRMPLADIGAEAARLLFALVEDRPVPSRRVVLPAEVVYRESLPGDRNVPYGNLVEKLGRRHLSA